MRLAFIPPVVVQIRNSHNYLADFDSEGKWGRGIEWCLVCPVCMYAHVQCVFHRVCLFAKSLFECIYTYIEPLYKRSLKLVEQLIEWKSGAPTLPARIEALWVYLYERGYIEIKDVELVQAWLQSLFAAG